MFVLFVMMNAFSCCIVVIGMGIPTKFKKGFLFIMMKVFSCGKIQIGYYRTNKIWDYMKYDNDQSGPIILIICPSKLFAENVILLSSK